MSPTIATRLLRYAGFALLPLFSLTCLFTCSAVNPMGVTFLTSFEVVNSTAENLIITPIGARGKEGTRGTLPISRSSRLYILSSQRRDFSLPAGSTLSLTYDWDDVQFSEILCRRADGSHVVLPTGLHPTEGQYRPPPTLRFEIADLASLKPADDLQLAALGNQSGPGALLYSLAGVGLLSPVLLLFSLRLGRRNAAQQLQA